MNDKIKKHQDQLEGIEVSRFLREFRKEFMDVYDTRKMIDTFINIGPMHSFLGFLVSTGKITINDKPKKKINWFRSLINKG